MLYLTIIFLIFKFLFKFAKYLNQDFHSFNTLLAENFYKIDNFKQAKKIYENLNKKGEIFFLWYSAKQICKNFN